MFSWNANLYNNVGKVVSILISLRFTERDNWRIETPLEFETRFLIRALFERGLDFQFLKMRFAVLFRGN